MEEEIQPVAGMTPIERRYYDAAVEVAREQIESLYAYSTDDGQALADISNLISGLQLYTTINHDMASSLWAQFIRGNDDVFDFVQRGATRALFLASVTPEDWQFLCSQLAFAMHPGKRLLPPDAAVERFIELNKSDLLEPADSEPAVDATIVRRTDLKATYNTLVNNQWLVWLFVISMTPFKLLGFKSLRRQGRRIDGNGSKPIN